MSESTQFWIVGIILAAIVIWLIYRLFSKKGRKAGSQSPCCGCSLSDACNKKNRPESDMDCEDVHK